MANRALICLLCSEPYTGDPRSKYCGESCRKLASATANARWRERVRPPKVRAGVKICSCGSTHNRKSHLCLTCYNKHRRDRARQIYTHKASPPCMGCGQPLTGRQKWCVSCHPKAAAKRAYVAEWRRSPHARNEQPSIKTIRGVHACVDCGGVEKSRSPRCGTCRAEHPGYKAGPVLTLEITQPTTEKP